MNWYKTAQSDISFENRLGDCYVLCGRYVLKNSNSELIHGSISYKGSERNNHAWVEYDNIVFDPVLGKEFPKDYYYSIFNVIEIERYSHEDVMKTMLRYNHWGPWNEQNPPKIRDLE